jgi:hypothetical protein
VKALKNVIIVIVSFLPNYISKLYFLAFGILWAFLEPWAGIPLKEKESVVEASYRMIATPQVAVVRVGGGIIMRGRKSGSSMTLNRTLVKKRIFKYHFNLCLVPLLIDMSTQIFSPE